MLTEVVSSLTEYQVDKLKRADADKYAALPDEGVSATIQYEFGSDISEAVDLFGDEVCLNMIKGHVKFSLQQRVRDMLTSGKTQEEIQDAFYDIQTGQHVWKPSEGGGRTKKSAVEKERDRLRKLPDEQRATERARMIAMLEEMEG